MQTLAAGSRKNFENGLFDWFVIVGVEIRATAIAAVLGIASAFLPATAISELIVTDLTTSITGEDLAEIVIGEGITIADVIYTGSHGAAGIFTGGADIIGIESGILLSTGLASAVVGPNTSGATTTGFSPAESGDSDLDSLTSGLTNDASVLEFDFVASSPAVRFRYVFGSEEYNEFTFSEFDDVFGFFINGVNVALLPDTDTVVSINTVNGGFPVGTNAQNPEFYINNDCFSGGPDGGPGPCPLAIEADGLTVALTITAAVSPGVNHIKLAIADVGDTTYDSWVFIEAESFIPDNDSWLNAEEIIFNSPGYATGRIPNPGTSRWYRFAISPGAQATIELADPPADYDIAVFKDIARAFVAQIDPSNAGDLDKLNAEFAPTAFSPTAFSPWAFSPWAFSPTAFSPTAFSADEFSPYAFSSTGISPTAFSPWAFSPWAFSPYAFSPYAFSPTAFSEFNPEISPTAFSEAFVGAQVSSLIGLSAGSGSEALVVDTWNNTGDFYVRVTGKNGAYNETEDFELTVTLQGELCKAVQIPADVHVSAPSGGYETLILWDSGRMDPDLTGNSAAEVAVLVSKLDELKSRPEVAGVVVDLALQQHIQFLQDQANTLASCPFASNLAARAIKGVVDDYRATNPDLKYVVIVGGDAAIPFFRYPDQTLLGSELGYDPPVADSTISQGSLRTNHILGQDEYGAEVLSLRDGEFPVPVLAVGRLVESAAEINRVLDAYLSTAEGIVDTPTSTLVTGYDFLEDTANKIQEHLVAGTPGRNDSLITAADVAPADPRSWTADQLRTELLDEREDIIFLAGHFSANSALAADYESILVTTELVASDVDLTNTLVYSAGCHSGYNIVDSHIVPGVTLYLDWPQAFAQKGATLVAGTGYQYGDTDFIEYSERLYLEFTKQLRTGPNFGGRGPVAIGEALVKAKQRYLAKTPDMRGLHRKSVIISTLFGLPMLRIDMPGERLVDSTDASNVLPTPIATGPGNKLGLLVADINFDFTRPRPSGDGLLEPVATTLTDVDSGGFLTATYLRGPDGVATNPAEPALPLATKNVSVDNYSARGLGFRRGAWTDQTIIPLTGAPTTEIRGVHIPFSSPVNYPMRFATLNYFDAIAGGSDTTLLVTPAQHRVQNFGSIQATLREFSDLSFRVFYSNNVVKFGENTPALSAPPSMSGARVVKDGADIVFLVNVFGDPAAGVQSAWATYTDGAGVNGNWQSIDLEQADPNDSTLWSGRIVDGALSGSFGRLDVMFQAVNGVGLVSLNDNFGRYYQIAGDLGTVGPDGVSDNLVETDLTVISSQSSGAYGDEVTLQAILTADGIGVSDAPILFTLGLGASGATTTNSGIADATLVVSQTPGVYKLRASYDGDSQRSASSAELVFTVNKPNTNLVISALSGEPGLTATLTDQQGTTLPELSVYFTVTDVATGDFLRTESVITNNIGQAHLPPVVLPPQANSVTARFMGEIPTIEGAIILSNPIYNASTSNEIYDSDGDGVYDGVDQCENTTIPEAVPNRRLQANHWALMDLDYAFDTGRVASNEGKNNLERIYTTTDTAGCSCLQIIELQGLGGGQLKHGCSNGTMDDWVELVGTSP